MTVLIEDYITHVTYSTIYLNFFFFHFLNRISIYNKYINVENIIPSQQWKLFEQSFRLIRSICYNLLYYSSRKRLSVIFQINNTFVFTFYVRIFLYQKKFFFSSYPKSLFIFFIGKLCFR